MGSDNDSVEFVSSPDLIRKPAHIHAMKDLAPLLIACWCWLCFGLSSSGAEPLSAGPLFHEFSLTLEPGQRFEALGPLFGQERSDGEYRLTLAPLFSYQRDEIADSKEFDFAYPLVTY